MLRSSAHEHRQHTQFAPATRARARRAPQAWPNSFTSSPNTPTSTATPAHSSTSVRSRTSGAFRRLDVDMINV
ncbi:hypothetical protein BUPH_00199 [Paraburkholderia phenoliruptrix BR3459a]|uniref:Uncharacterized protein n=1 Tax=Paraburkholderia phenoliruptrix BR3459a TaxID=1229205 RepID=K0DRS8_9BURK|nr:hypothetical protein BUPH_00199 [Paraburkholderia phenoliruptrix BR3459a]